MNNILIFIIRLLPIRKGKLLDFRNYLTNMVTNRRFKESCKNIEFSEKKIDILDAWILEDRDGNKIYHELKNDKNYPISDNYYVINLEKTRELNESNQG